MDSKHLTGDAVDLVAYINGQVSWELNLYDNIADAMKQAADMIGVQIREPEKKSYPKPQRPANISAKSDPVMTWLKDSRKLSAETIAAYKVVGKDDKYAMFPHLRDGELCNYKLRNIENKKDMRVAGGCEQMLFGWQAIPKESRSVVICEGEIDALTLWQSSFKNVLSVPNGANLKTNNLEYFDKIAERFINTPEIYLCFDNDNAGRVLREEFANRLGKERCKYVEFKDCKDANDCLQKYGLDGIIESVSN
jgi:twinkle protein